MMRLEGSRQHPRFLDLFCGIGGLSLGFQAAGFAPVVGVDIWAQVLATFRANHVGVPVLRADIAATRASDIESAAGITAAEFDVVVGGPPCQGFSTVGKRLAADPRNLLWQGFLRLVCEIRPAYVVIENVDGLNVMSGGRVRDGIISEFNAAGYAMKAKLLRAADFGVPQLRKRLVFLGWLDGLAEPRFPTPAGADPVSVAAAISDLPTLAPSERKEVYESDPSTNYQRVCRGSCQTLHNHEAAKHPAGLIEVLRHVPDGGNRKSIPDALQPKSGFHNSYSRLASWKPAVAVTSNMRKPSSARATHPTQHRGLTVREGLRLQSFADDFVVLGSRTDQYVQVGNAVPPLLALAVAREVLAAFRSNAPGVIESARGRPARPVTPPGGLFDAVA